MKRLQKIKRLIISVGHGGAKADFDTGAVWQDVTENSQCRLIAGYLVQELLDSDVPVLVIPDYSLVKTIDCINRIGDTTTDWAIELHKDYTDNYDPQVHNRLCGFYFLPSSQDSEAISKAVVATMIASGANTKSWTRSDGESNHGGLGFLKRVKCLSHVAELGFMQDNVSDESCRFYAKILAKGIMTVLNTVKLS